MEEMKEPKVSVVIATHNNAKKIGACIDSLWNGGFSEFEVIAVDVNSTDGTKDILAKMAAEEEQITFLADSMGSMGHARNFPDILKKRIKNGIISVYV